MANNAVTDWSPVADSNTEIAGINIAENCPAEGINNAIRTTMAQIAAWLVSTNGPILKLAGAFPNATAILDPASVARKVGYRDVPQNPQTGAYVLALADVGEHVSITTGGITVPLNATVAFPIGTAITIVNNSAIAQSITPAGSVTLRLAGTVTTGTRGLSGRGMGTLLKVATDEWYFGGAGVS